MTALASWDLVSQIEAEHEAAVGAARASLEHAARCGDLLLEAQAKCGTLWGQWVDTNLSFGQRQAQKYARFAREVRVKPELLNSHSTLDGALSAVADRRDNSHFRTSFSGDNEWHTPAAHLAPVRQVLGAIDLDPASNDIAQMQVGAASHFTKNDDGLSKPWHGRVFMNLPFAYPAIERFIDKLLAEMDGGRVTEAVVLTNNFSDTTWFHKAARRAAAICFTKGRVRFESPEGAAAQPTQGQTFFYFGPHLDRFRAAFADHGLIMVRLEAAP